MMRGGWFGGGHALEEEERLDAAAAKRVLRRTFRLLRPYRRGVAGAVAVMLLSTAALLAGPILIRYGIDHGLRKSDEGVLNLAALLFLVVAFATLVLGRLQVRLVAGVGERFLRDLRVRVFDHLQSLSLDFFGGEQTGRLVARMTSDIEALTELVQMGLVLFVTNGLLLAGSVFVIVGMSPLLALVCLIALPVVIAASVRFQRRSNQAYLVVRDRIGQTLSTLQEDLSGVRVIQAFAREDLEERRFSGFNRAQLDANMDAARIASFYFPVIEFSGAATTAAVIGIGGLLVQEDLVTVGTVAAFVLYLSNLFEPIQQLSQLFNTLQSAGAALSKLFGLLDTPPTVRERPGAIDLPAQGAIEVKDVAFTYDGAVPVLQDVTLAVEVGERLALVGPTGAGKSTLAKLVARLHDPTSGRITIGGVDLRDATLSSLRRRVVVVPQEGFLFGGTIRDNVRVGRDDATDAEIEDALRAVGAYDRFAGLPDGLDTEVRERGSRLSAGERQLVSLARAALANPDILVLDEATSSLDPGTEAAVEIAMGALMEGRTVVVIAHRLSTAERADRVAVVDEGRLAELGTHDELLAAGGRYAALFGSWAGEVRAAG
jgi:ATP-binding cassette subfamily B protein